MLFNHPLVWVLFALSMVGLTFAVLLWLLRLFQAKRQVRRATKQLSHHARNALADEALRQGQLLLAHTIHNPRQLLPGGLEIELLFGLAMFALFAYACEDVLDPKMNYRAR